MPNWCNNSVRLSASKEKIDALVAVLEDKDNQQVFQHLRPMPDSEKENWYDWNINNWGTKWDMSIIDWDREDDATVWIAFDTAWSPPEALYEFLFENEWYVEAYYHESGMAYCGQWIDGEGDYFEYSLDDWDSIDCLPDDIKEFTGLVDYYHQYQEDQKEEEQ
jgi:hypothetical protein